MPNSDGEVWVEEGDSPFIFTSKVATQNCGLAIAGGKEREGLIRVKRWTGKW